MSQTIRLMSAAKGVQAAADHAAATAVPGQGSVPALTPDHSGDVIAQNSDITLTAANDPMATGDIYVGQVLPAGMQLLDTALVTGDIDSATALTLTVAELNQDFTDIVSGTDVITASTVGQAGGVAKASVAAGLMVAVSDTDRWFGVKVANAPTGLNAGAKMRLTLFYNSQE